ncbi:endonuclease/exonuclease/phosphatase family protein [Modestobacter sp. SYSU DS0657]
MHPSHLSAPRASAGALALAAALAVPLVTAGPAAAGSGGHGYGRDAEPVRFATYNVSMFRTTEGELADDLADADDEAQDAEVRNVAEVVQRQRPDVLLLNEFDHDAEGLALERFQENFLAVGQGPAGEEAEPIEYPYAMVFASNTGVASGFDLNDDGTVGTEGQAYGDDSFGFGTFPGQYAFAVLSKHPIDTDEVRTFQEFRWADMPGARLPDDPATPEPADFYSAEELDVVRLSSKNHVDVPVQIGRRTVHVLASHPTPPTFDGPEDRNGLRNADEIRFWADYVTPGKGSYIYDDQGEPGGLHPRDRFVIMGDLNADPADDGNGLPGAADQVIGLRQVQDPRPTSEGAAEAAARQGGANLGHDGDPALDTADFADGETDPGNLRVDHVLPSKRLRVCGAGVFWPSSDDPLSRLTGVYDPQFTNGFPSSDHRMVWVDIALQGTHHR